MALRRYSRPIGLRRQLSECLVYYVNIWEWVFRGDDFYRKLGFICVLKSGELS